MTVDFDGTLCRADSLEWMRARATAQGLDARREEARAQSKQHEKVLLWELVGPDVADFPIDPDVVAFIAAEHDRGRETVLVTGSSQALADAVSAHLGVFTGAIGSTHDTNLTGTRKAARLVEVYGEGLFDYLGDSDADVPVWSSARRGARIERPEAPALAVPPNTTRIATPRRGFTVAELS